MNVTSVRMTTKGSDMSRPAEIVAKRLQAQDAINADLDSARENNDCIEDMKAPVTASQAAYIATLLADIRAELQIMNSAK